MNRDSLYAAKANLKQLDSLDDYVRSTRCFEDDYRSNRLPMSYIVNPFETVQPSIMENQMMWISESAFASFSKVRIPNVSEAMKEFTRLEKEKSAGSIAIYACDVGSTAPVSLKFSLVDEEDLSFAEVPRIAIIFSNALLKTDRRLANLVVELFQSETIGRYVVAKLNSSSNEYQLEFSNVDKRVVEISDDEDLVSTVRFQVPKLEAFEICRTLAQLIKATYPDAVSGFSYCCLPSDFFRVANAWNECAAGARLSYYARFRPGVSPTDRPEFPEGVVFLRLPLFSGEIDPLGRAEIGQEDEDGFALATVDVIHTPDESYLEVISDSQELLEKFIDDSKIEATIWRGNFDERW